MLKPIGEGKRCENIFIHGPTGSGKTPLIKHILEKVKNHNRKVVCLHLNCWHYTTSMAIYSKIADALGEPTSRRGRAVDEIFDRILETMRREDIPVILALDELSGLISRGETRVFHNISTVENNYARFGIIGISEDKHILSKLQFKVKGRLRFMNIELKGYSWEQLFSLLKNRAEEGLNEGTYNDTILKKIADVGVNNKGNARLVLEILRKSAKRAEYKGRKKIELKDVEKTVHKLYLGSPKLSREEQIIIDILRREEKTSSELYWLFCKQLIRTKRQIRNYLSLLEGKEIIETRVTGLGSGLKSKLIKLKTNG